MKCGIKSNPDQAKMSPTKLNSVNLKLAVSPVKYEQSPCKGCEMTQDFLPDGSIGNLAPKHDDGNTEARPKYNKENLLKRLEDADTQDVECSGLQDSGYSSILQGDSPYQDEYDSIIVEEPFSDTPKSFSSHNQRPLQTTSSKLLPALHFEEVVCSTLKKSAKRRQKIDWDDVVSRESFRLEYLIGKNMGLEKFDILGELFQKDFKHLLTKILRHLSAKDLINVIRVSTTWKKILHKDRLAYQTYSVALKELLDKEAKLTPSAATREVSLFRVPLASVQKVASSVCCFSKKKTNKQNKNLHSRHLEFNEIAKTLKNDESLKVCTACGSPAKYDSYLHRAQCTRDSCKWDFCTICLCNYHYSESCRSSKSQGQRYLSEPLPGSRKSKHNLKRL
ncbi:F-box only protein 5 [Bombina bombina]|uniref:F-box only protein 5 n=1 Tax=Bombina bombina TaxID=8345 RepID=UPI00235A8AE2|nr:F-box only protein 5 [Bombina bombina]